MASIFTKFFGRTVSEAAGVAAGIAVASPLRPVVQAVENETWKLHPDKPVPLGVAAAIVAEKVAEHPWGQDQAASQGYSDDAFEKVWGEALNAPGVPELLTLLRRSEISPDEFVHGLRKAKLEQEWDAHLLALLTDRLDPSVIATAIQRGIIDDPGFLPVAPPSGAGKVPAFPVSPLDPLTEAKASGIDRERLFVETAIVGNPMSPDQAAQATYRGVIERTDFDRAIAEGNTRNEWRDAIFETFRQILTSSQYVELQIRGFYDRATRLKNTRKHGMSDADSDLLYDVMGRSPGIHTVTIGLARGGKYPGSYANVPEPFRSEIQRSNIREEWAEIAYAARYTYPSGFQIRGEAQAGRLSPTETREILLEIGWSPKWAEHFAASWTGGTTSGADSHVSKAQTHLWTTTHASYKAEEIDSATATATLGTLGVSAAAIPQVLALWDAERALIRAQLSPSQVKKAVAGGVTNPATGAPWTFQDGVNALLARGYNVADATVLLQE